MSSRLFICMPVDAWQNDPVLNFLPDDCKSLAFGIAAISDSDWRLRLRGPDLIYILRQKCFSGTSEQFQRWDKKRISRAFELLLSHACFTPLPAPLLDYDPIISCEKHGPETWLRVADRLQYHKGDDGRLVSGEKKGVQRELPLISAVPVNVKRAIPMRVDEKKRRLDPESAREQSADVVPMREQGTREQSLGVDPERFARGKDAESDPLWAELHTVLGLREITANGALWLRRLRLCRDALAIAVRDFKSMTAANQKAADAAKYITAAFENEKRTFQVVAS